MSGRARRDAEFTDFVERASAELLRIAWYLTGDVHRANDLVQSSLVKTYLAWSRIDPGRAVAFTRRIMLNQHTDDWRRNRGEVLVEDVHEDERIDTLDRLAAVDTSQALVNALRRLPQQQRLAVVLRHYCDLSEKQVAQELGTSVGAVKSNTSRGLAALRQSLIEEERAHEH